MHLNDRQDFFGQTVNIASRVQELATDDTIFATHTVVEPPKSVSFSLRAEFSPSPKNGPFAASAIACPCLRLCSGQADIAHQPAAKGPSPLKAEKEPCFASRRMPHTSSNARSRSSGPARAGAHLGGKLTERNAGAKYERVSKLEHRFHHPLAADDEVECFRTRHCRVEHNRYAVRSPRRLSSPGTIEVL